jgi:hypothetical protein
VASNGARTFVSLSKYPKTSRPPRRGRRDGAVSLAPGGLAPAAQARTFAALAASAASP